jgi:F-type H+-transporting ATPase subunit a
MLKKMLFVLFALAVIGANLYPPLRLDHVSVEIEAAPIVTFGPFIITSTIFTTWLAMAGLAALAYFGSRRLVASPSAGSLQNIIQTAFEALLDFVERFAGPLARAYFPVAASFFLFVLTLNWLSLLPGFGSIGLWQQHGEERVFVPLLRGANADLNTTVALALVSVISAQVFGMRVQGSLAYLERFVRVGAFVEFFRRLFRESKFHPGLLLSGLLDFFIGLLEIFEELTKIISFSFRLFGNVFGGEVLLLVMAFILPYVISIPFIGLEIMSGFVQALIFAVLSTAFAVRAATAHGEPARSEDGLAH